MKGIVVDILEKQVIVLSKHGEYIKIKKNQNMRVGDEMQIPGTKLCPRSKAFKAVSVAAAFLIIFGLSCGVYSIPYSYVDIDINPSVEVTVNIFDRIIDLEGFNEDGRKIIEKIRVMNKHLAGGIEQILKRAKQDGYIGASQDNAVLFTVVSRNENRADNLVQSINETVDIVYTNSDNVPEVLVEKIEMEKHKEVKNIDITPGKRILIEKLSEMDPQADIEQLEKAPVKDIMKNIKDIRKEIRDLEKDDIKDGEKQVKGQNNEKNGRNNYRNKENHENKKAGLNAKPNRKAGISDDVEDSGEKESKENSGNGKGAYKRKENNNRREKESFSRKSEPDDENAKKDNGMDEDNDNDERDDKKKNRNESKNERGNGK